MEMEEEEGLLINPHIISIPMNRIVGKVPGSQVRALVSQDDDTSKPAGPVIQIFLVGKAAVLAPVIAPLNAALTPPAEAGEGMFIAPEGQPTDIVDSVLLPFAKVWRKTMPNYRNRVVSDFIIDRPWFGEEEKVRVQIGDRIHFGVAVEDEQRQRRRTCEIVFNWRSVLFRSKKCFITSLNIFERNQMDV
jgi:hypothetical protein